MIVDWGTTIMAKTKRELNALKEEAEILNEKIKELTEEELAQVSGGVGPAVIAEAQG